MLRAAALGLVFPGAGLLAVGTLPALIFGFFTLLGIPLVLFAWFGAGGLAFPLGLWLGSTVLAGLLAKDTLFNLAAPISTVICVGGIIWLTTQTSKANSEAREKRKHRNEYVVSSVRKMQTEGQKAASGSRELSLRDLRFIQWFVELGMQPFDDLTYHDVIDQFQTAAIRYQLYESVSDLGLYQFNYAPNFHGYLSLAQRRIIEKSLTERVVGFWKWESSWGKFKFSDWVSRSSTAAFLFPSTIRSRVMVGEDGRLTVYRIPSRRTTSWCRATCYRWLESTNPIPATTDTPSQDH